VLAFVVLSAVAGLIALVSSIPLRAKVMEMIAAAGFASVASFGVGTLVKGVVGLD